MWELIAQLSVSIFLAVLAGDLLLLYYKKGWTDPNKLILRSELGFLYAFVIGGLANVIRVIIVLLG